MDLWRSLIAKNNYMFGPIAAIFRLLQFCSKSVIYIYIYIYMPILWGDVIWSSLRVTISLFGGKSNRQWLVGCKFSWGGGSLGAVIIDCVVSGIQLGWGRRCGLVCSTSSGFSLGCCPLWEFFGLRFPLFVCVRARGWAHLLYIGSGYSIVLSGSWFWFVCAVLILLCPLYNAVGVVLLSFLFGLVVFLLVVH